MKHPRRTLATLLCALVVALGVAAPGLARAVEPDVANSSTMYTIISCPECNGLPHDDYWTGVNYSTGSFNLDEGVTISSVESGDESLVTARLNPETGEIEVRPAGGKTGTAYITVTFSDGSTAVCEETVLNVYDDWDAYVAWTGYDEAQAREEIDWTHYATLVVDGLLPDEMTIQTSWGESYLPFSYTSSDSMRNLMIETSYEVADPSVLTVSEDGIVTPLKAGTTDVTMTITDLAHPEATFTDTATYTVIDDGETPVDPWAEDGKTLLPYTIKDGVMTFDGRPDLGEWYQLDLDLGEGVVSRGLISGGSLWTMTITADSLDPSDPLYSRTGYVDGPFFVRGDNHGAYTSLSFNYPEGKALSRQLVGSGTVTVGGSGILFVQLSGPSTLELSVADETVVSNEQGASISHAPNDGELGGDDVWSTLSLVTDHLGGDVAQAATDSVVAVVDGVTGHPYVFDIHLEDMAGEVFQIPGGDKVIVTLPIPEGLSAEGLRVFHVADDGTVTDMDATVDAGAGTVSFETTHFSTFVLANVETDDSGQGTGGQTTKPAGEKTDGLAKTGDPGALPALLASVSGSAALLGAAALRRRR